MDWLGYDSYECDDANLAYVSAEDLACVEANSAEAALIHGITINVGDRNLTRAMTSFAIGDDAADLHWLKIDTGTNRM